MLQQVVCLTLNHKTGYLRDFTTDDVVRLQQWATHAGQADLLKRVFSEFVCLSTCNRIEVYGVLKFPEAPVSLIQKIWPGLGDSWAQNAKPGKHIQILEGADAVRHLFRVASSLESVVVGEPQILGQIKQSYMLAKANGWIFGKLDRVFQKAFKTAKDVRTRTSIAKHKVSVLNMVQDLIPERPKLLVMGAGQMIKDLNPHLASLQPRRWAFVNRNVEHAGILASDWQAECFSLDSALNSHQGHSSPWQDDWDVILTCTGCPSLLLTPDNLGSVWAGGSPLVCVDLSVPRNCCPSLETNLGIKVVGMAELAQRGEAAAQARFKELKPANDLVEYHLQNYISWINERDGHQAWYA